jgi:hypothetical protein
MPEAAGDLWSLLLGSVGALVLSLLLNYAFMRGWITPRNVVPLERHDKVIAINEGYAARFGEQTDAVKALTTIITTQGQTIERLAERPLAGASRSARPRGSG